MAQSRTLDNPIKVLLIEDNPGDARLIQLTLADDKPQSIQLETVDRLSLGCKRLMEGGIDVVLLDLSLPDSQGFDTLAQMQATAPNVPIVVLTGLDNDQIGLEAVSKGAQDYLVKGQVDRNLLARALRYAIERKRAEVALREAEQHYRSLFEGMPVGLYRTAPDGRILDANSAMARILGYPDREVLMTQNVAALYVDPQDREVWRSLADSKEGEVDSEIQVFKYDGTALWLRDTGHVVRDSKGKMLYYEGALEDITERKRAEEALAHERDLLRALMDNLPDYIYFKDTEGRFTRINEASKSALRIDTVEEALGKTDFDFFQDAADYHADEQEIIKTGQPLIGKTDRHRTRDGQSRWVSTTKVPIKDDEGRVVGIVGATRDITQSKKAEEEIRQHNRELALLNQVIAVATSTLRVENMLGQICQELAFTFNVPRVEAALMNPQCTAVTIVAEYLEGEHRSARGNTVPMQGNLALQQVVKHQSALCITDARHDPRLALLHDLMNDLGVISLLIIPLVVRDQVAGIIYLCSSELREFSAQEVGLAASVAAAVSQGLHNARLYQELETYNQILEQSIQEATVEVRRTKERVGAILDNSPDAILLLRSNGAIESGNPAFQELLGYHIDDLYGQLPTRLIEPGHVDALQDALQDVIDKQEKRRIETVVQRLDGTTFDADIALAPTQSGHTLQGIVCSLRDITALKEVERMKDAFISNVSHELRTPITGIKLSHRLIGMDPGKQPIYMERMGREIERLHDIIENLLRLSRLDQGRVVLDIKPLDLNTLAVQYVSDRTPLAKTRQLTLSLKEEPGLPLIQADEGLLGQVLSILLTNALSYTPIGGEVMVSTQTSEIEGKRWVGFSVSDTGPGIPAEDLPHLGERFYRGKTGRDSGAPGTGLGLAIAHEIVEQHHGRMETSNTGLAGIGATFTVWLPTEPTGSRESNAGGDA